MNDLLHRGLKWVDHNRYLTLCVIVAVIATGGLVGCKAKTASLFYADPGNPAVTVTRPTFEREVIKAGTDFAARKVALQAQIEILNTEIAAVNTSIDAGRADLARKEEFRAGIVKFVGGAVADAMAGTVDPGGLVTSALLLIGGAAGLGATADNFRKNAKIKELKADGKPPPPA